MDGSLKLQECLKMRVVALASLLLLEDVCPQNIQQFLYVLPRVFCPAFKGMTESMSKLSALRMPCS